MKQFLFCFLFTACLACTNSDQHTSDGKETSVKNEPESGSGCTDLVLFHTGAIIEGKSFDSTGKEVSSQVTTITAVRNEGKETIADAKMDMKSILNGQENSTSMTVSYKCDGSNLYVDMGSVLSNFAGMKNARVQASSLQFPMKLSVGQDLPDASVSFQMDQGEMKMKSSSNYTNRKVELKESVTTSAGTWNCFKIVAEITTEINMGESATQKRMAEMITQKMPARKMVMWFTPGAGIVKTESYSGGKLESRSEITSIRD